MEVDIANIFEEYYLKLLTLLPNIITAIVVCLIFFVIGKIFYKTIGHRIQLKWKDSIVSSFLSESMKWGIYLMGIVIALHIVGFGNVASSLIAGAGIGAIVIGFAFKDIAENFLAGILLALNRQFEIEDIIEVGEHKGRVKDLDLRNTHIRSADGRDIYIPNSHLVKDAVTNYTTDGFLRLSFLIGIAPECDIEKTRSLILGYIRNQRLILKQPIPNVIVKELGEFTTDIEVQIWIDLFDKQTKLESNMGNNIRSRTITEVKKILDENGIEMPSQVLEHKMYRDHQIRLQDKSTTQD